MARTVGAINKSTREFVSLYETLVAETGTNPVEVLFKLCKNKTPSVRLRAASELLPFRYPRMASEAPEIETQNEFLFSWDEVDAACDQPNSDDGVTH